MANFDKTIVLNSKVAEGIVSYVKSLTSNSPNDLALYDTIDTYIDRTYREPNKPRLSVVVPVISPQVQTTVAYLASTFLTANEVFPVTTELSASDKADAVNSLFAKYSNDNAWRRNLLLAFTDAAKYNRAFVEGTWVNIKTAPSAAELQVGLSSRVVSKGFRIKHLPVRSVFYDPTVNLADLSSAGEYAGYYVRLREIALLRALRDLELSVNLNSIKYNLLNSYANSLTNLVTVAEPTHSYARDSRKLGANDQWHGLFSSVNEAKLHEMVTLYLRASPKALGLSSRDVPNIEEPTIFKLVIVNGTYLVHLSHRSNIHDMLPIVCGVPNEGSHSIAEELIDIQMLASNMLTTEYQSNKRIIADRGIFNPHAITRNSIENPAAGAKIELKPTFGGTIDQSYRQIPYNDPALGTRLGLSGQIAQMAQAITGQNAVSTGQFVRGNKTNAQFNEVLARSDARQVTLAVMFDDQMFATLRSLLLYDFMQYQDPIDILDPVTGNLTNFAPADLINSDIDFRVNDALSLDASAPNPEAVMVAMQTIQAMPELQEKYDLPELFAHFNAALGVKDLAKFIKKPAEPQGQPQPTGTEPTQPLGEPPVLTEEELATQLMNGDQALNEQPQPQPQLPDQPLPNPESPM